MSIIGNVIAEAALKVKDKRASKARSVERREKLGKRVVKAEHQRQTYVAIQEEFIRGLRSLHMLTSNSDVTEVGDSDYVVYDNSLANHNSGLTGKPVPTRHIKNKAAVEIEIAKALIGVPITALVAGVAMVVKRVHKDQNEANETGKVCDIIQSAEDVVDVEVPKKIESKLKKNGGYVRKTKKLKENLFLVYVWQYGLRSVVLFDAEGKIFTKIIEPRNISKIDAAITAVKARKKTERDAARLAKLDELTR